MSLGSPTRIPQRHLTEWLIRSGTVTLFGMNYQTILELQKAYHMRGGCVPITEDSVRECFKEEE